jgi:F-type H+-transporting ATPase subunit gamma
MAEIRIIQRRIRSITSTAKITKAMEMIATSKMRRAQERALAGRPYAEKMRQVLAHLASQIGEGQASLYPLLEKRPVQKIAVLHITADRGLCGGLNANVNRSAASFLLEQTAPAVMILVGRKGRDFMLRHRREIRADFTGISDRPTVMDTLPISHILIEDYENKFVDEIYLSYTRFVSTVVQKPVLERLLPIELQQSDGAQHAIDYIYEPSSEAVLDELLPRFVEMQVYHSLLEAIASEQSARRVAMRNATDNANELVQDLTLMYNKARQEGITKELLDITGGVEAAA